MLEKQVDSTREFLDAKLNLNLHPNKILIKTQTSGVDFLGTINFPDHKILRIKTKKRILRKLANNKKALDKGRISPEFFDQSLQSYLGILKHCQGYKVKKKIQEILF